MPNWNEIDRCPIWKVLGVTECNYCDTHDKCWGENAQCTIDCQFCPSRCNLREREYQPNSELTKQKGGVK